VGELFRSRGDRAPRVAQGATSESREQEERKQFDQIGRET
jgi:hypothetical protein